MKNESLNKALAQYPEATAAMIGLGMILMTKNLVQYNEQEARYIILADEESPKTEVVTPHNDGLPSCSCVDDPFDESNAACAHVLAVAFYEALRTTEKPIDAAPEAPALHGAVMTEAPYSLNVSVEDPDGYQYQFTVRKQEVKAFFAAASGLREWIKKQGFAPVQRGGFTRQQVPRHEPDVHTSEDAPVSAPAQTANAPQHSTPAPTNAPGGAVYRFHAETLLRSEMNGKVIWAVQGQDIPAYCRKFGMRIWPEVLEAAGFDPVALEEVRAVNLPSLHGYTAQYCMRADDEKKPDKIIALVKA